MQLPRPEVIECSPDDLPSEIQRLSAFAPLLHQWRACVGADASKTSGEPWLLAPVVPGLDPVRLERFQRLMQEEGWSVQASRMQYDRVYARERIATAHGSSRRELRWLSLHLARLYDEGEWPKC